MVVSTKPTRRSQYRVLASGRFFLEFTLIMLKLTTTLLYLVALTSPVLAAEDWEVGLQQGLVSEYSQTRHDAIRQIDTKTVKGLKALWKVLALRDPQKYDWYVRLGAWEALANATSEEAEKEIDRVLGVGEGKKTSVKEAAAAEDELAREAIIYSIINKIWDAVVRLHGQNDDRKIAEVRHQVRKARGPEYFALVLPAIAQLDPEKKQLHRLQAAFQDKSPRVRRAAITGLGVHPDASSIPLLIENLKKLEKQKTKNYREWVLTRGALETLSGQNFRDNLEDWGKWWELSRDGFSIAKRAEEAKDSGEGKGKTVVVSRDGVEVTVNMKVAGQPEGYPLVVLPLDDKEVDYFRPYFHGIEEFCRVYYLRMPQIGDFKGLARDEKSNTVVYPTRLLAKALVDILEDQGLEKFGLLAHGPHASTLAMMFAADNLDKVSHLVLINPRSSGEVYSHAMDNVQREGRKLGNKEAVKGIDSITVMPDGNYKYKPADAAEQGGVGRAIANFAFADPSEPEVWLLDELYTLPGGVRKMNDSKWSARQIFQGKKIDFPVAIYMCEKAIWTPLPDQNAVAGIFNKATIFKMPESADYPFISETYAFTRNLEAFFKPAIQAKKAREAKAKEKADKAEKAAGKTESVKPAKDKKSGTGKKTKKADKSTEKPDGEGAAG